MSFKVLLNLFILSLCLGISIWGYIRWLKRTEDPSLMVFKTILSLVFTIGLFVAAVTMQGQAGLLLPGLCAVYGVTMAILWGRHIGALVARPLTSMFDGGTEEVEPQPLYSIAVNKIKRGFYQEAAFHIKEQLLKFPNDFTGQRLLAQLQAEHLNDLAGAQVTIEKLCAQPGHARSELASVLNELADWHLKFAQDTDSARATLEKVIAMFPDSEAALHAQQRIAHLASPELLLAAHDRPAVRLRPGIQNLGLHTGAPELLPKDDDSVEKAREYVAHLEQHPHDAEAREKLAWIYARHYGRPELAIDQMEQIFSQPSLAQNQMIHCLNVIADMHLQFAHDLDAARAALQRIVEAFPDTSAAEAARNRIDRLRLELRAQTATPTLKLGTYEQNIGLKRKP
jgi:outer membrane protein assembly factor BamD (BamD/ComL family)